MIASEAPAPPAQAVDPPSAVTELTTTQAAEYCNMKRNMFCKRAAIYGIQPARTLPNKMMFWTLNDLTRLRAIRREAGRTYQNISLDRAAELIARRKSGLRPALEAQLKGMLTEAVAAGKLDLTGLEQDGEEVMRRVYQYLLHGAGDWLPVEEV